MSVSRFDYSFPPRYDDVLSRLKEQTGDSKSAWLRDLIEYGTRPEHLNNIRPAYSGQLSVGVMVVK